MNEKGKGAMDMTNEENQFFHLVRNYAEPRYPYRLKDDLSNDVPGLYTLRFESVNTNQVRQVIVFKDQFDDAVAKKELGEAIIRNIDDALKDRS